MLRLFARGPKGKGAGNPHETKEQAHQASLLRDIYLSAAATLTVAARVFGSPISRRRQDSQKGGEEEATDRQPWLATCSSPPFASFVFFNLRIESVSSSFVCAHRTFTWMLGEVAFPSVLGLNPVLARDA